MRVLFHLKNKLREVSAAFGLLQLKGSDKALQQRKLVDQQYSGTLAGVEDIECLADAEQLSGNYPYFFSRVKPEYPTSRDVLFEKLRSNGIYARRYFYSLISDFPMYRSLPSVANANLPFATRAAKEVICLPI